MHVASKQMSMARDTCIWHDSITVISFRDCSGSPVPPKRPKEHIQDKTTMGIAAADASSQAHRPRDRP